MMLDLFYKISDQEWLLSRQDKMKNDVLIIGSEELIKTWDDKILDQIKNVASLPGICEKVVIFPNAMLSDSFPVGSVALLDPQEGIICLNAVGNDINCGTRIITTNLIHQDIEKKVDILLKGFAKYISPTSPTTNKKNNFTRKEIKEIMTYGAKWIVEKMNMGKMEDLEFMEDKGVIVGADPDLLDEEIFKLEKKEMGLLGGGGHFLEIQVVDEIFDIEKARTFGIFKNQIVVTYHTGLTTLSEHVVKIFREKFLIFMNSSKSKDLMPGFIYVPAQSKEGKMFLNAQACIANLAFASRQIIYHYIHYVFNEIIKDVDTYVMYDFGQNMIREETHEVGTRIIKTLIHRRGTVRNFSGKVDGVPNTYKFSGQPVIISGGIGNPSYIMAGREEGFEKTFGTSICSVGKICSVGSKPKNIKLEEELNNLQKKKISLRYKSKENIIYELSSCSRDIEDVVNSINKTGISQRVARLKPLGILKG